MKNIRRSNSRAGRYPSFHFADIESGEGPQNVEDNVETPLLLQDLDGKTSLWQHDNPWIRLPAQFVRWIWQLLIFLIVSVHPIFFSVLLTVGIFLSISLSRGGFPVVLLMVEAFTAIAWAIYSGISRS